MKKILTFFFAILVFMSNIGAANAATWELALGDKDNKFYVDTESAQLYQNELTIWIKAEHTDPFKFSGVKTFVSLQKINLLSFTHESIRSISYLENGQIVNDTSKTQPEKIAPFAPLTHMSGKAISAILSGYQWINAWDNEYCKVSHGINGKIYFWNKTITSEGKTMYFFERINSNNTSTCFVALADEEKDTGTTFIGQQLAFFNETYDIKPNTPIQKIAQTVISNWEAENL